jgi:charged multivesicular body protein 4
VITGTYLPAMFGWFGGGNQARRNEAPKKAILQLRGQLGMLSKRESHLQNQMDEQDTLARKYVNTNKTGILSPFPSCRLL